MENFARFLDNDFVRLFQVHSRDKIVLQWLYHQISDDTYYISTTTYTKSQQGKWLYNLRRTWKPSEASEAVAQLIEAKLEAWYE